MKIVCYGDSNTYGYDAADVFGGRLPPEERWPDILASVLGAEVVNCGMNGRTVPRYPRQQEADLRVITRNTGIDLVIIILGTNDLLLGFEAENTADHMKAFLNLLKQTVPDCRFLLIAPPPSDVIPEGCDADFSELAAMLAEVAECTGVGFADAGTWSIEMACDGVHFSPQGHRRFAFCIANEIKEAYSEYNDG